MSKRIIITIKSDGSIVAETTGNTGPACLDDLAVIEDICDTAVILDSKLTPEYFQSTSIRDAAVHQRQNQQNASDH